MILKKSLSQAQGLIMLPVDQDEALATSLVCLCAVMLPSMMTVD